MNLKIPKDQKIYSATLHSDVVWGIVLRPPHDTTPVAVKINKF